MWHSSLNMLRWKESTEKSALEDRSTCILSEKVEFERERE